MIFIYIYFLSYWSNASLRCLPKRSFHEWCIEDLECLYTQNLECNLQNGTCDCMNYTYSFWEYGNQTCQTRSTWKEPCLNDYGCVYVWGLECDSSNQCDCKNLTGKYEYI